ncbi:MAG: nucleoside monophosphate kinase [Candidatus Gracilibacteria bacterium]|jgi:adenylate kinase
MHKKHIMLMGIQGSGKGTQAAMIARHFGFITLETGAILRAVLENPHHKHYSDVSETLPHGKMVPDAIIFDLIQEFFDAHPNDSILIDGAVRNIAQRKFFDAITTDYIVIHIELSEAEALQRLQGRRMDPVTKEIFGADLHGDINPATGNTLVTRIDDQDIAKIHERFAWYATDIIPLLNSWKHDGFEFYTLNGAQHREDVWHDIKKIIG